MWWIWDLIYWRQFFCRKGCSQVYRAHKISWLSTISASTPNTIIPSPLCSHFSKWHEKVSIRIGLHKLTMLLQKNYPRIEVCRSERCASARGTHGCSRGMQLMWLPEMIMKSTSKSPENRHTDKPETGSAHLQSNSFFILVKNLLISVYIHNYRLNNIDYEEINCRPKLVMLWIFNICNKACPNKNVTMDEWLHMCVWINKCLLYKS